MKCFIVTGTSRGLGEAIAARLIAPEHLLFCISRRTNDKLINLAKKEGAHLGGH